jgi:hypothetical protein
VRLGLEQTLTAEVERVESLLADAKFIEATGDLPKVGEPELVDQRREGDLLYQRVHSRFAGQLSSAVTAVIDPRRLTWVEETIFDLATHTARFRIVPDHFADRLQAEGRHRFRPTADHGTRWQVDGDLRVRAAFVATAVERAIISGLEEHLRDLAALIDRWEH